VDSNVALLFFKCKTIAVIIGSMINNGCIFKLNCILSFLFYFYSDI
jgi:hypothetical protein